MYSNPTGNSVKKLNTNTPNVGNCILRHEGLEIRASREDGGINSTAPSLLLRVRRGRFHF